MKEGRRAPADLRARRINDAAQLLASGLTVVDESRTLAARFRLSERQARRYVERARDRGTVEVPDATIVFTVKLPEGLVHRLRSYARTSGRTLSSMVAQAVEDLLARVHPAPPSGR
jgi:predicted alpha/beta-hydrolase family hydrolase